MHLLVLGGTWFVGHAIVKAAIDAGWEVTTFNRGTSDPFLKAARPVRGDRTRPEDIARLAAAGSWDAVVDTSGYVPANTLAVARALAPVSGYYVFVSSVSVYQDWPAKPLSEHSDVLYCPPDASPDYGTDIEDGPTQYGYQKAGSEAAAVAAFGVDRTTILRPGVVLGPREYVGRLPWWLRRVAAGGEVLAPGSPDRTIQPVDVRDLAAFTLHAITEHLSGPFNVCAPVNGATFGDMLTECAHVTRSDPSFTWIPDDALLRYGVRQWSELPLWRTFDGVWRVETSAAQAAGLRCRPLAETVRDTWRWMVESGEVSAHDRAAEIGISREKEAQVLDAWRRSGERTG
ncbi:NAD-dependent epimerase/dehydratase family protein [Verrucosispora sioxanthis]|uniref:NAD-dependent epimerase/dehydratase family protein n=1 Tax=Verrucosispora sioxanthis TaxID=2499994 RepID=A0A6M1KXA7_9ACTN|nr:NAD-dependent epimerase/dehydratase family protein [Verrucosispora sioxanthis]NEE64416.1 NAD-dependent epimerase/dehydratase family protein [Verrucosispora sioxanthis]NGM13526.1 NAD-dependent epimerase/dehydratase family protein [Verrucosispora sioxanthis]